MGDLGFLCNVEGRYVKIVIVFGGFLLDIIRNFFNIVFVIMYIRIIFNIVFVEMWIVFFKECFGGEGYLLNYLVFIIWRFVYILYKYFLVFGFWELCWSY